MSQPPLSQPQNPYVGPRPFMRGEADRFFGRERECRELQALVLSNRLVLFYARSGAGKSSLVNARLIPGLEEKGFEVLPVARVTGGTGFDATETGMLSTLEAENPYLYNLMLSLDQSGRPLRRFAQTDLAEFLINLVYEGERYLYSPHDAAEAGEAASDSGQDESPTIWPRALIIDQFEEILTTSLEAWQKRADFFRQLARAMKADPYLWVVLTMREDHVAGLDPYAHMLPGRLRTRYYMQPMDAESAREAIVAPAADHGRPFGPGVASELVDNLRQIRASDGGPTHLGQFVEPDQLQVVCYQLWENLRGRALGPITEQDLLELGNVDATLAQFYEQALQSVLAETTVSEARLRHWFASELITEAGTRGLVYQGSHHTGDLPNEAVRLLANKYLIRAERRAGGVWYELVHDRFVGPILDSNRVWQAQQAPLFRAARAWERADRDPELLYRGTLLEETLETVEKSSLEPLVQEFLQAGEEAQREQELASARARAIEEQERAETEARSARRLRLLAGGLLLAFLVAASMTLLAIRARDAAGENLDQAFAEGTRAAEEAQRAAEEASRAAEALATAQRAQAEASTAEAQSVENAEEAVDSAERAMESLSTAQAAQAEAELRLTQIFENSVVAFATSAAQEEIIVEQQLRLTAIVASFFPQAAAEAEATSTPRPTRTPTPAVNATATPEPNIRTRPIGRSPSGEQLNVVSIGHGDDHLVLVGGIHAGFAPGTVELAGAIRSYLEDNAQIIPDNVTVDIVEVLNPDSLGLTQVTQQSTNTGSLAGRLNANGVDLNRNWSCNWVEDASWSGLVVPGSGGSEPLSEPETRGLNRFLASIERTPGERIGTVVVWQAKAINGLVSPGACEGDSQASTSIAELYADAADYRTFDYEVGTGQTINGDMVNTLDSQGIPAITVLLPSYDDPDLENNLPPVRSLLAVLGR